MSRALTALVAAVLGLAGSLAASLFLFHAAESALDRVLDERLRAAGESAALLLGAPGAHEGQLRALMKTHALDAAYLLDRPLNVTADAGGRQGQPADFLRRVTTIAYRTRELQIARPDSGIGSAERSLWEANPAWQPARKAVEYALASYDWGEAFTALNLVLGPTLDDVLLTQLGEVARANGDDLTWLLTGLTGVSTRPSLAMLLIYALLPNCSLAARST